MSPRDTLLARPTLPDDTRALVNACLPGLQDDIALSVAHEVNQPLAAIALHSAAARKWLCRAEPDVERALASLALISEAGRHAGDIVRVIKRQASREATPMACVNLDQTIHAALRLVRSTLCLQGIRTRLALTLRSATIQGDPVQLQQVVTNLLVNAIEALSGAAGLPDARSIKVGSGMANGQVEITVEDNGPGIAPAHRDRIFSSLFSTKAGSTGLGLAISLDIVRAHQGSITFEPCAPHGALFRVRLPLHRP